MKNLHSGKIEISIAGKRAGIAATLVIMWLACWFVCFRRNNSLLYAAVMASVAILLLSIVRFRISSKVSTVWLDILWGLSVVLAVTAIGTFQAKARLGLNCLCTMIVIFAVLAVMGNWKKSVLVGSAALLILLVLNEYVFLFRGKELGINDLLSWKTAINVANQYKFAVVQKLFLGWLVYALALFGYYALPVRPKRRGQGFKARIAGIVLTVVMIGILGTAAEDIPIKTWEREGTNINGFFLNFYLGIRDAQIKVPENYRSEDVDAYCMALDNEENAVEANQPNIIVIMDESFSDLCVYPNMLNTNIQIAPVMESLKESTIHGYALSSVFGGSTANSEFEFLTGHSMAFLPEGSVPYQQYISEDIYTLAWNLKAMGYSTFATHPFYADGWSRNRIYPLLGLPDFTFIEDYKQNDLLRGYVSDREAFEYVLDYLKNKPEGEPLFLFDITMQNHGGYQYKGDMFEQSVFLEGTNQKYPKAEQYLSVLHETDSAVGFLLTELEQYPEDTVVLFFGDHQAKLEQEFYEEINNGGFEPLDHRMRQYMVPFFVWANYDLNAEYIPCTSINYLARYLLECAGLDLPPYFRALKEIEKTIPALNALGYYSKENGCFMSLEDAQGAEAEALARYEMLQYNNLFDEKNRAQSTFGQYMLP